MDQSLCEPPLDELDGFAQYSTQKVRIAVAAAAISRAHGVLLAALRADVQDKALDALLAMDLLPGVGELKSSILAMATPLAAATFDKSECTRCRFNSGNHGDLFELSVGAGYCLNTSCADRKVMLNLEEHAQVLRSKYRVVQIQPEHAIAVQAEGQQGVGEKQAGTCRESCSHFGASVSGSATRQVITLEGVCFNPECHASMVDHHRQELLGEYKSKVWRTVVARHIDALPLQVQRALMLSFLALGWNAGEKLRTLLKVGPELSIAEMVAGFAALSSEEVTSGLNHVVKALLATAPTHQVYEVARGLQIKLEDHWMLNGPFLERLSLQELDHVAKALQVDGQELQGARATGDRVAFAKAIAAKLDGPKTKGYIPACLAL